MPREQEHHVGGPILSDPTLPHERRFAGCSDLLQRLPHLIARRGDNGQPMIELRPASVRSEAFVRQRFGRRATRRPALDELAQTRWAPRR